MMRSRVINTFGLDLDRRRAGDRAAHQVPRRRLDRDPGDGRLLPDHARHPPPLRPRRDRAGRRRRGPGAADPGARDRAGLQAAQADAAGAGLRQGDPAQRARGGLRRRPTPRRPRRLLERVGRAQHRRTAQGAVLAVPRDDPADRRVRRRDPARQPARRGRRLHPGVRRRPLVGAAAAQPDRAAAQGPAAVHAGRDGHLGALPAALLARSPASASCARTPGSGPATCAAARSTTAATTARCRADPQAAPGARKARGSPGGGAVRRRRRPGRARRPLRRPAAGAERGWSSSGTRCPASGSSSRSPRAPTATGSCAATRSRCWSRRRDRVAAPCPFAGPGRVRRLRLPARRRWQRQRRLKADVVREQLSRLAGLDVDVEVGRSSRCPATQDGLRWRTRQQYVAPRATAGSACASTARTTSSRIDDCLIAGPRRPSPLGARARDFAVAADGFWQVHPGAPDGAGRHGAGAAATRGRGSRRSTCTPASGCSPRSSPRPSGRPARCSRSRRDVAACAARRAATSPAADRGDRQRRPGAGESCPAASTSSCSTRRARRQRAS